MAAEIQSSRSEPALERSEGMTCLTPLKPAHGKPSLQMPIQSAAKLTIVPNATFFEPYACPKKGSSIHLQNTIYLNNF